MLGNEAAIRFGRRRLIALAMIGVGGLRAAARLCRARVLPVRGRADAALRPVVWLDSSSLTAGTAGTAEPSRRGATLAVHSMLGYVGGFVGPLAVGWTLDLQGANTAGWTSAFCGIAALSVLALIVFLVNAPARNSKAIARRRGSGWGKRRSGNDEGGGPAPPANGAVRVYISAQLTRWRRRPGPTMERAGAADRQSSS